MAAESKSPSPIPVQLNTAMTRGCIGREAGLGGRIFAKLRNTPRSAALVIFVHMVRPRMVGKFPGLINAPRRPAFCGGGGFVPQGRMP